MQHPPLLPLIPLPIAQGRRCDTVYWCRDDDVGLVTPVTYVGARKGVLRGVWAVELRKPSVLWCGGGEVVNEHLRALFDEMQRHCDARTVGVKDAVKGATGRIGEARDAEL